MAITRDEVRYVAMLFRMSLSEEVRRHRALYRRRARQGAPVVWLVGYTNAGKEVRSRPLPPPGELAERWPLSRRLER